MKIDLISRRADITASRWRVEAAEHSRESARAEFFPDISINALVGFQSIDVGTLHRLRQPGTRRDCRDSPADIRCGPSQGALWGGAGGDRFGGGELPGHGGRRRARRGDAGVEPRSNCGGTGRAPEELDAASALEASAAARVRQGVIDPRAELRAAETWIQQRDALLQLDAAAVSADIGLQRALGGGYDMKATP